MMLKGVSANHREPDIYLPIRRQLLQQTCEVLPFIVNDWYLVILYRSMLTLAFNGLLRPGEFSYSLHVLRVENVYFHNATVILLFPTIKAHYKSFPQKVTMRPTQQHCPIRYLLYYLQYRPPICGALYIKQDFLPIQYPVVLKLFQHLSEFLALLPDRFKPHCLRIEATTELQVQNFSNLVIKERSRWSSSAFQH